MGQVLSSFVRKPEITHVIFDLDGTLINSEERYFALQIECLAKYGKTFDMKLKRGLLGRTTVEEIREIIRTQKLSVTEEEYLAASLYFI